MEATMLISSVRRVGKVDPRLYSSFIEHMGRAVYEGFISQIIHQLIKVDSPRRHSLGKRIEHSHD